MLIQLPDDGAVTHQYLNTTQIRRVFANGPVSPPTDLTWLVRIDGGTEIGTVTVQAGLTQAEAETMADEIAVALGVDWEQPG